MLVTCLHLLVIFMAAKVVSNDLSHIYSLDYSLLVTNKILKDVLAILIILYFKVIKIIIL